MDEQRLHDYLNLIQLLLTSSGTEEAVATLQSHSELIDAGLLQLMEEVATQLADRGDENAAEFLRHVVTQLIALVDNSSIEKSLDFLLQVLQVTSDSKADPKVVYAFLQANLDKLDASFAKLLQAFAVAALPQANLEELYNTSADIVNFSTLIAQFPLGDKANNLEIAISGYEIGLTVFTQERCPEQWATIQNNLANVNREQNNLSNACNALTKANDRLDKIAADLDVLQSSLEQMDQQSIFQTDE